jgi:Beta-propeller domains of methanol dehydrogenase type
MKRICSLLLIVLLLLPMAALAENGQYVFPEDGILSEEELASVNARSAEIAEARGVGVYWFYDTSVTDLPAYIMQFAETHVTEENALVLGFNADYYYFLQIGSIAEEALPDSVCDTVIMDAYRAVKNDNPRKLLAYLNAVDAQLAADQANPAGAVTTAQIQAYEVPDCIARTKGGKPTFYDRAQLLTAAEAEALSKRLLEIGNAYRCDVVIATVPDLDGKTAEEYADDFFDYGGYGYGAVPDENGTTVDGDGVLLLLSMADRDFTITTSGYGITAFTDYGIQIYLEKQFLPYLSANNYAAGFNAFADGCDYLLKCARAGEPFDAGTVSVKTANGKPIIVDHAAALSTEQIPALSEKLRALGDAYKLDVIFVTDYAGWSDGDAYAEKYFVNNGYGYVADGKNRGGILVYYEPNGPLGIYVDGEANSVFKGRGLYKFRQDLLRALYGSDYSVAALAETLASRGGDYLKAAANGHAINPINWIPVLIAVGVGILLGRIPVSAMKRKLTDVYSKTEADSYLAPQSFKLTQSSDVLLNRNVTRTLRVQSTGSGSSGGGRSGGGGFHGGSSTHTSSSGGTHGGHSGKF